MGAPELDALLPQLRDPDPDVRSSAAGALGALGPDGVPAIAPLFDACRDASMYVRGEALHSLWEIAGSFTRDRGAAAWPLLEAGVPSLIAMLDDPWWSVRCSSMSLLERIGLAAGPALPRLRAALTGDGTGLTEHPEGWSVDKEVRLLRECAVEAIEAIDQAPDAELGAAGDPAS